MNYEQKNMNEQNRNIQDEQPWNTDTRAMQTYSNVRTTDREKEQKAEENTQTKKFAS